MHSRCSKDSHRVIQAVLEDYFDMENTVLPEAMLLCGAVTGLSKQLARPLARNALQYCSQSKLATDFGDIQPHHQENIVLILQSVTWVSNVNSVVIYVATPILRIVLDFNSLNPRRFEWNFVSYFQVNLVIHDSVHPDPCCYIVTVGHMS